MPSTFSPNLRLELIASGEQANTWGNTTNTNLGTLIEQAITGYTSLTTMSDANYTLIALDGASDQARQMFLDVPASATLSATRFIIAPAVPKIYVVRNNSTGGQSVVIATATSGVSSVTIPNGRAKMVACDGTNFTEVITSLDKLFLGSAVTYAGSASNQAVTKAYVDTDFFRLAANNTVTGNTTFSGTVTVPAATPTGYQATSFNYVNSNYLLKAAGGPAQDMFPYLRLQYTPVNAADAVPKTYVDSNFVALSGTQTITGTKIFTAGVSVSGAGVYLTLANAPASNTDAANKLYVDTQIGTCVPTSRTISAASSSVIINGAAGGSATLASNITIDVNIPGGGITSVSVASANGFSGASSGGSTPQLTLSTTVSGLIKGSNSALTAATASDITTLIGGSTYYPYSSNPSSYVTSSSLSSTLAGYVTTGALSSTLAGYVTTGALSTTLAGYVTTGALSSTLAGYVTTGALSSTLTGYLQKSGGMMTGALNIQNTSSPAAYATVDTVYSAGNYYPAFVSTNTASTQVAALAIGQKNSLGNYQTPLIFSAGTTSGGGVEGTGSKAQLNYTTTIYGDLFGYFNTNTGVGGNATFAGTITAGTKPFRIPHPIVANKDLVHIAVEAPRADLIYRGVATLVAGEVLVDIDAASNMSSGTFAALTQNVEVCALHNKDGFTRVRASGITDGMFVIYAEDGACTDRVAWVVVAERADQFMLDLGLTDAQGRLNPEQDTAAPPEPIGYTDSGA